jgi:hypothetical protein
METMPTLVYVESHFVLYNARVFDYRQEKTGRQKERERKEECD